MDLFCKNPSFENYRKLPDKYKYAFHKVDLGDKKNMFKEYLFRYRKEFEETLFYYMKDLIERDENIDILYVYEDPSDQDNWLFSIRRDDNNELEYRTCYIYDFSAMDSRTVKDEKEAFDRFKFMFRNFVITQINVHFKDGKIGLLYDKRNGYSFSPSKPKVPKTYKQDKTYIEYVTKFGFIVGTSKYERYKGKDTEDIEINLEKKDKKKKYLVNINKEPLTITIIKSDISVYNRDNNLLFSCKDSDIFNISYRYKNVDIIQLIIDLLFIKSLI